jgi:hypothetical protein
MDLRHLLRDRARNLASLVQHRARIKAVAEKQGWAFDRGHFHVATVGPKKSGIAALHTATMC